MEFILADNLKKSVKTELYKFILEKIYEFSNEFVENDYNLSKMGHGWYVREIRGNTRIRNIFKFRVNSKDRIIFTFGNYLGLREEFSNSLVFLEFCNHDTQIRRGRNICNVKSIALVSDELNANEESEFDKYINEKCYEYEYDTSETINRIVSVEEIKNIIDDTDSKAKYYLNNEQFDIIKNDIKPLFLFGSAGSGKTTISIYKAHTLYKRKDKVGYFTYSDYLKKDANNIFDNINNYESSYNISFYQINDYILNISKKPEFVKYEEFELWVKNILVNNKNFLPMDIWKEIRGIIKGIIPIAWIDITLEVDKLSLDFIDYLTNNDFVDIRKKDLSIKNDKLADLNTSIKQNQKINSFKFIKDMEYIYTRIDEIICSKKLIEKETYLNLKSEYSTFNKGEREYVYSIAQKYQKKLDSDNRVDENDIVRIALKNINNHEKNFDFIICDEIQDLTEMELYFLLKIVKNKENILFSGDYNQTINPTFFKSERIEAIFKIWNGLLEFKEKIITTNYRSSRYIVEFSNKLRLLKNEKLRSSKKHDYEEIPIRDYINKIFILNKSKITKKNLVSIAKERAYVDILVPNDYLKNEFVRDTYSKSIYTVKDYKGLENKYIIGYNIISQFNNKWKEIFSQNNNINDNEFRYYFNLVYVFITRARDNICFIEEDVNAEFLDFFKDYIEIVSEFNVSKLKMDKISTSDEHYKRGLELEAKMQYEKAIDAYKNAKNLTFDVKRAIKRCEAFEENNKGFHKKAAESFMGISEYKHASDCYIQAKEYVQAINALVINDDTYEQICSRFKLIDIEPVNIINENSYKTELLTKFNIIYEKYLNEKLEVMNDNASSIAKTIDDLAILIKL